MPQPEGAGINQNVSPYLTGIAVGMMPRLQGFVASRVAPTIPVAAPSGAYMKWNAGDFMRRGGKKLSNYEAPPIEGFGTGSGTYKTSKWGVSTVYTAQDVAEARIGGVSEAELRLAKTEFVTGKGALEREIKTAAVVQTAGNWSGTKAGVTSGPNANQFIQWDQAASDPVQDVQKIRTAVQLITGQKINKMVLPVQVKDALLRNANLIDRIKYGGTMDRPTQVTVDQLKALFEIDDIVIPEATYNAAAEGAADNFQYVWGTTVWFGFVTPTPSRQTFSALYNFAWSGDTTAGLPAGVGSGSGPQDWGAVRSSEGIFIRSYLSDRPQGQFVDAETFDDPNVVSAALGYTLTAPIA